MTLKKRLDQHENLFLDEAFQKLEADDENAAILALTVAAAYPQTSITIDDFKSGQFKSAAINSGWTPIPVV